MKRKSKNYNRPIAILTGDWHLRDTQPKARTDDFWEAQWKVVHKVFELSYELGRKYDEDMISLPIIHSGDLYDNWKPSPHLLAKTIEVFKYWQEDFILFRTVYGNHDLPQHNIDLAHKTGIQVLEKARVVSVLNGTHWGNKPTGNDLVGIRRIPLLIWHVMTWKKESHTFKGDTSSPARKLLEDYEFADVILTGHNHIPFVEHYDNRVLVNPGGITRQTADQMDIEPRVYLLHEDGSVKLEILPYSNDELTNEHNEKRQEKDERISAFVQRLNKGQKFASFEDNLDALVNGNKDIEKTLQTLKSRKNG
jgi:DNA repair exonuclease SbcCD nuclease subunit